MKIAFVALFLTILRICVGQPTEIGEGAQPQLSVAGSGIVRLVYGQGNKIFYSVSGDGGTSFSIPSLVAEIDSMHLGMSRGPQLASSKDYSIVTAIDKKGNIHAFQLDHKSNAWNKISNINDIEGSAPEGFMSIAADEANHFYAVWLDLRDDKHNKIAFSSLGTDGTWSRNKIAYRSPEKSVCECCKPTVAVRGKNVFVMFRNSIGGSRDLYLVKSADGGSTFGSASKLGNGTWQLRGCPMDGGGIVVDEKNVVHTLWQRSGVVYYDRPGQAESKIATGRSCNLFGSTDPFLTWQEDGQLYGQTLTGDKITIGEGRAVCVARLKNGMLAVWEREGRIVVRSL